MYKPLRLVGALLLASTANLASAHITVVTYSGTVNIGTDFGGLFGVANSDLAGVSWKSVYRIDDTVPATNYVAPNRSAIFGGRQYGQPISPVNGTITIKGVSFTFKPIGLSSGEADQSLLAYNQAEVGEAVNNFDELGDLTYSGDLMNEVSSTTDAFTKSSDFRTPLTHIVQSDDLAAGGFSISVMQQSTGRNDYAFGNFDTTLVTVGGVPEPTVWATLVAGFGITGSAMRRRAARRFA